MFWMCSSNAAAVFVLHYLTRLNDEAVEKRDDVSVEDIFYDFVDCGLYFGVWVEGDCTDFEGMVEYDWGKLALDLVSFT